MMPPRVAIASLLEHITLFGLNTTLTTVSSAIPAFQYLCIIGKQLVLSDNDLHTCSAASELVPGLSLLDLLLELACLLSPA